MTEKQIKLLEEVLDGLNKGEDIKQYTDPESQKTLRELGLISTKPHIIVNNVD